MKTVSQAEQALAQVAEQFSHWRQSRASIRERIPARTELLILDDWGLTPIQDEQRRDLLEILDDRFNAKSTVIASQLPINHWHDYIGDSTLADAILDRLVHNAYRLQLRGESMRKRQAISQDEAAGIPPSTQPTVTAKLRQEAKGKLESRSCWIMIDVLSVFRARSDTEGQEATALVLRLPCRRLGAVSKEAEIRIRALPLEDLEALGQAVLDPQTVAELMAWLEQREARLYDNFWLAGSFPQIA
jgi:hypothetical protein